MTPSVYGKTRIVVCEDEDDLGERAAVAVAECMRDLLASQDEVRVIFAGGESQTTFFDALAQQPYVEWDRVIGFNMDDFWDPRLPAEYAVCHQTVAQLYSKVKPKAAHSVRYDAPDAEAEARCYEELIRAAGPMDILCQGIGMSGHLAFNEPGQTDFNDAQWVRVVDIVEASKQQLLQDPNFMALGYIPEKGITMTIPAMLSARHVFTIVPLALKRSIVTRVLNTPEPDPDVPASIISTVRGTLFLDRNSCPD